MHRLRCSGIFVTINYATFKLTELVCLDTFETLHINKISTKGTYKLYVYRGSYQRI